MPRFGGIATYDLSLKTGWAYGYPGDAPIFGSISLGRQNSTIDERLVFLRRWLVERIDEWQPKHIWFMRAIRMQHDNNDRLEQLFGYPTVIMLEARERGISWCRMSDATVISEFTGQNDWSTPASKAEDAIGTKSGKSRAAALRRREKKRVTMAQCLKFGCDVDGDDDAGDSLALFFYAEMKLAPRAYAARQAAIFELKAS